ncbi:hypothetical protein OHA18_25350 [Kribbella sp. NBC_00709]|nr:hypothetical protein [Kribbella sp. NBC_00709]
MSVPLKAEDAALVLIDHQVISMSFIRTASPETFRQTIGQFGLSA